jgi:hypothetical protein
VVDQEGSPVLKHRVEHRADDKTDNNGVLKYLRRFMLSNLPNLFKNVTFKKASLHVEKM